MLTEERLKSLRQHADEMAAFGWKDDAETIYALLAAHSAGAQEPGAWHSIPDTPPVELMEWYGDQFSVPVLLHDEEKILPFVARWSFPEEGWVGAQLSDGPSPYDYEHLNEKHMRWMLLSDVTDCTHPQPMTQTHSAGAQTHKIIDDGEVVGYVVPSIAAHPALRPSAAREFRSIADWESHYFPQGLPDDLDDFIERIEKIRNKRRIEHLDRAKGE